MFEIILGIYLVAGIFIFGPASKEDDKSKYPARKPTAYELRTLRQTEKFYGREKDMGEFVKRKNKEVASILKVTTWMVYKAVKRAKAKE